MKTKQDIINLLDHFDNSTEFIEVLAPNIDLNDIYSVVQCMCEGWHGTRKYYFVERFEKEFAEFVGRKYCITTTNCTNAIHLLLSCINTYWNEDDEIITNDLAWIAPTMSICQIGVKPVFADVNYENWCLDGDRLEEYITNRTRAVLSVNLYSNLPDYDKIEKICKKHNLILIEDAAESLSSSKSGTYGKASVFSFQRTKTLCTGQGGAIVTDDYELYRTMHWKGINLPSALNLSNDQIEFCAKKIKEVL